MDAVAAAHAMPPQPLAESDGRRSRRPSGFLADQEQHGTLPEVARSRQHSIKGLQRCEPFVLSGLCLICAANLDDRYVHRTKALCVRGQVIRCAMRIASHHLRTLPSP